MKDLYVKRCDYRDFIEVHGKYCPACKKIKTADEFSPHAGRHDGKQAYCSECQPKKYAPLKRAYERTMKGRRRKERYKRALLQRKREQAEQKLRESIEKNERLYFVPPSLVGSTLGMI